MGSDKRRVQERRYRAKAAHGPVKQRKQQNQAAWEDDKKSELRRVKGMKIQRHKQTLCSPCCFGFFFVCFLRPGGGGARHGSSTVAAFQHLSDFFLFSFSSLFTSL